MQKSPVLGAVHSTESFGAVDGPGIRFLIFLKGCPMRCRYCHNADSWDASGAAMRTADELLCEAERYRAYWGREGGITVSGGEPLVQIDFLLDLFEKAKERGISTCLDTSGAPFTPEEPFFGKFRRLMDHTDLVLLDLKQIDGARHRALTGRDNANILQMARCLSDWQIPVWIRHVLVPGLTDRDDDLLALRRFLDTLHNVARVEVLPYHAMGEEKWARLGQAYTLHGTPPPSPERLENARRILGAR